MHIHIDTYMTAPSSFIYLDIDICVLCLANISVCTRLQAYVSVKRINKFMNMEELDPNNVQHDPSERKCKIFSLKVTSLRLVYIIYIVHFIVLI